MGVHTTDTHLILMVLSVYRVRKGFGMHECIKAVIFPEIKLKMSWIATLVLALQRLKGY